MSEQGWRAFLEADGLDDRVVLHGGAAAAFVAGYSPSRHGWPRRLAAFRASTARAH